MTLKKLIENTTAASNQSWITRSITFIAGWWKSSPKGTPTPSAITRTPRPQDITNRTRSAHFFSDSAKGVLFCLSMSRSLVALLLIFALSFGGVFDAVGQTSKHQRKSKKPKSPPCRTGCKPETSEPQVAADTPEDEAAQKELSELARELGEFLLRSFVFRRIGRDLRHGRFRLASRAARRRLRLFRFALVLGRLPNGVKHPTERQRKNEQQRDKRT